MGNNVIDSLVVLLDLDPSKFDDKKKKAVKDLKETKEETRKGGDEFKRYGKEGANAFSNLRNEALRYIAVFIGAKAIKDFTVQTVQQGAAIGRVAYNAGVGARSLGVWQQAVKSLGGDANAAGQSMFNIAQELQKFQLTGESSIIPYFRALGISITDATGHLKGVDDLLIEIADKVEKKQISGPQASFVLGQLGLSPDVIQLVERGGSAVRKYLEQADKIVTVNDETSHSFEKLQGSWENLIGQFDKGGTTLLAQTAPKLSQFIDILAKGLDWLNTHNMYGDTIDPLKGTVTSQSAYTKATENDIKQNAQQGFIVDPSGAIVPIAPDLFDSNQTPPPSGSSADKNAAMIRNLEHSRPGQLGPVVNTNGVIQRPVGQNQILPTTASDYGFDPSRLREEAYNDTVARAIEADLAKRYDNDPELIALAYHNGKGAADRYQRFGRNLNDLGPQTQKYIQDERGYASSHDMQTNVYGDVNVYTQATDATGIARDIKGKLEAPQSLAIQNNSGPQ